MSSSAHPERRPGLSRVARAKLPTAHGLFAVYAYIDDDGEHLALVHGELNPDRPALVRLHSACITGDVFASMKCDCGQQLDEAIRRITAAGSGIVLYLDQEGRGIGLANKMRAYEQQDAGLDTVDANTALGFDADQRNYEVAANILEDLSVGHVELLTNNPRKAAALEFHGLTVDRVPLEIQANPYNRQYLATKAARLDHDLEGPGQSASDGPY